MSSLNCCALRCQRAAPDRDRSTVPKSESESLPPRNGHKSTPDLLPDQPRDAGQEVGSRRAGRLGCPLGIFLSARLYPLLSDDQRRGSHRSAVDACCGLSSGEMSCSGADLAGDQLCRPQQHFDRIRLIRSTQSHCFTGQFMENDKVFAHAVPGKSNSHMGLICIMAHAIHQGLSFPAPKPSPFRRCANLQSAPSLVRAWQPAVEFPVWASGVDL